MKVATAGPILLTGATGFVGGALARALLAAGTSSSQLRLLVRDRERARRAGLPAESLIEGDLGDPEVLDRAAAGVGVTLHLAGAIKGRWARDFYSANATGTASLVAALCRRAPGSRMVHVSSLAAAGPSVDGVGSALPAGECSPRSHYGRSKRDGELAVAASGDRLRWVILRPPVVYGPDDAATRLLMRQSTAPVAMVPWTPRPLSLIHVDDVVRALLRAAETDATGVTLPLDGPDRADTGTLVRGLAQACGRSPRVVPVPLATLWPLALAADLWALISGRASVFGRDKLRDLTAPGWVADPAPARKWIGFSAETSMSVGLAATAAAEGWSR